MSVKPKYVKDLGKRIFELYPDNVSNDFEVNKQIVIETTDIQSAEVRNRVAGYLCSLKNQAERQG